MLVVGEGVQESGHYRLLSIVCCVFVRGLSSGEHL